ncbi:MAG: baseplate J/gp47 family protein [Desulfobacterales bacterium]|nr:baseplate J/gp47 family protein [Desulfobacterales bacterium]
MTAPRFTPNGIEVQTYDEIYQELADGYRLIYGNDINLDPDSPDGQRVAIEAQARLDVQSFGSLLYNQLDPDFALGEALNSLIKLSGITRRPATRSQVDVSVTASRPVTLPVGYAVEDTLGQVWETISEIVLAAGITTVTLFAENFGAVEADPATVAEPVTFVIGVDTVTNPLSATVGREEETDEELRIRRNHSLETPRSSALGRLFTAVGDLAGVIDMAIYENDTDATDIDGIPAHSLWVVVEGGAVDDIAESLAKNKTGGKGMVGAVAGEWTEEVLKPDGTTFTIFHTMSFDRPTYVTILVKLNATRKDQSSPIDTALIANKISEKTLSIGENLLANDLYRNAFEAGDNFIPTGLEISRDAGVTWTAGRLVTDLDEKFIIGSSGVTVTEII